MTKEEFLNRLKEINIKTQDKNFFLEYNAEVCDILTENEHLKDNWNKLKEYAKEHKYFYSGYQGEDLEIDLSIAYLLDKMQELEECDNK